MPPNRRKPASFLIQLVDLLLIELTNWRWSWRSLIITATLAPVASIMALGIFARDSGPDALAYVLTGNLVMALMFGNMEKVESHFVFMRFAGGLDYLATLPIRRFVLILALVLAFLALSLPSLVVTILVGVWYLGVPVHPHPFLILVVPLCALPLASLGALIGCLARTPQEAGSLNLVVMLLMLGLGPVVVPPERLPGLMIILGRFSPATYAASALRQVLLGPVTGHLFIDLAVLAGLAIGLFWLVGRLMDWRQR